MTAISFLVESFEKASVVRCHHICMAVWTPTLGEELLLEAEGDNEHDKYAVCVVRRCDSCVAGHIPRKDFGVFWFFLKYGGRITYCLTGRRKLGVVLKVPCIYIFASTTVINKLRSKLHS